MYTFSEIAYALHPILQRLLLWDFLFIVAILLQSNIRNSNYYVGGLYSKDYCDSNVQNKQYSNSEIETLFNNWIWWKDLLFYYYYYFFNQINVEFVKKQYSIYKGILQELWWPSIMGLLKLSDVAKNLFDVMFAMMKVHGIRLLDNDKCSVTATKTYVLQLAFCTNPQHICCIVLYCIVLYCIVLYCIVIYS